MLDAVHTNDLLVNNGLAQEIEESDKSGRYVTSSRSSARAKTLDAYSLSYVPLHWCW